MKNSMITSSSAMDRRKFLASSFSVGVPAIFGFSAATSARPEGVNRPDLLPSGEQTNVIDLVKTLTPGQQKKLNKKLSQLETDTGFQLRVLCQQYPETPGSAIKEYWNLNEKSIVMVVDQGGFGRKSGSPGAVNPFFFNVGDGLQFALPSQFWTRLQNKLGNKFYIEKNGIDQAVLNSVDAISACLRQGYCVDVPQEIVSSKAL